ncbi:hypothetical protein BDZ91DRAFT_735996 [Kalaharituber pfeilii]|nr:hypothetical protein BDZ91DRAFT_735996 [Kalaharituber pfeilii]
MLTSIPKSSPPARREMYFLFNHLHKYLIPICEEPEEQEERRPRKIEAWRKRIHLPDYRKVKIGEYYEDTAFANSSEDSDVSTRSSFESDSSVESVETHTEVNTPKAVCAGCSELLVTSGSHPTISHNHLSAYERAKLSKDLNSKTSQAEAAQYTQFRCTWPGCKIVLCSKCTTLMRIPKASGGMGGSLPDLQAYWEKQRNKTTGPSSANMEKADGAITADIVQALTSNASAPRSDASETMTAVDSAVAVVDQTSVEKVMAKFMSNHEELCERLGEVAAQRERGDTTGSSRVDTPGGRLVVVTVKEIPVAEE